MNASMLVGTYLLVIAAVCAGVGFAVAATAIMGPIGLAVSCAIALGIGIFCAYTHYKSAMATARRDAFYDFHDKQLSKLSDKCNHIRKIYCPEKSVRLSPSDTDLTSARRRQSNTSPTLQRISFLSKNPIATHTAKDLSPGYHPKNNHI